MTLPFVSTESRRRLSHGLRLLFAASLQFICVTGSQANELAYDVLINEVDSKNQDESGADGYAGAVDGSVISDFVELRNFGAAAAALDGKHLVLYNGSAGTTGQVYASHDLAGFKFPIDNLLVIGSYGVPNADIVIDNTPPPGVSQRNWLEYGADGIALYSTSLPLGQESSAFLKANAFDTWFYAQGLSVPPPPSSFDSLKNNLLNSSAEPVANEAKISSAKSFFHSTGRLPTAVAGARLTTTDFQTSYASPGLPNLLTVNEPSALRLSVQIGNDPFVPGTFNRTLVEGSTTRRGVRITRSGSTASPLTVNLANLDPSEMLMENSGGSPVTSVTIPAGQASADFFLKSVDDFHSDGTQKAYFNVSATSFTPAAGMVFVEDAGGDSTPAVSITEVHSNVFGDANGDGFVTDDDQFIEIVNHGASVVDLTDFTVRSTTTAAVVHTFGAGSVLLPGQACVIFGDVASDKLGTTSAFGTAVITKASTGSLGLVGSGGVVRLFNAEGTPKEVADFQYWPYLGGSNVDLTADGVFSRATIGHQLAGGTGKFSPGQKVDGTSYLQLPPVEIELGQTAVALLSPAGTAKVVATIPAQTFPVTATITSLTPSVATIAPEDATITFAVGETSKLVPITHLTPGTAQFKVTSAVNGLSGDDTAAITVTNTNDASNGITFSYHADTIVESAGPTASAVKVTVVRPVPDADLSFAFSLSPGSAGAEFGIASPVTIPTAVTEYWIPIDAASSVSPGVVTVSGVATNASSSYAFGAQSTFTVVGDEGIANGPFLTEFQAKPVSGDPEFVEIYVPGATGISLDGLTLAVFDASGVLGTTVALGVSDVTDSEGMLVVGDAGGNIDKAVVGFDLPDAGGAIAIYRGAVASLTGNNLLDSVVYGSASEAVRKALTPQVISDSLAGKTAVAVDAIGLGVMARSTLPATPANLRAPEAWAPAAFGTPGYAPGTASFIIWLEKKGLPINSDPLGNGDGDIASLIEEFAFGGDPAVVDLTGSLFSGVLAGDTLTLSTAPFSDEALVDLEHLDILVQASTTLLAGSWSNVPWTVSPALGTPVGTLVLTGVPGLIPKNFFRLALVRKP